MDGFDQFVANASDGGNLTRRWVGLTSYAQGSSTPWSSGTSLATGSGNGYRSFAATGTVIGGIWYNPWGTSTSGVFDQLILLSDGASTQLLLGLVDGALRVCRNTSATVLGTSAAVFTSLTWHRLEFKAVIHSSTGAVEIRVNGTTVLNLSGINTSATGSSQVTRLYLDLSSTSLSVSFDDLYLLDTNAPGPTDFLTDWRVRTLQPTGAGSSAQFTPTSGSNYDRVNDIPPSASDAAYVSSTTNGHVDLHAMADVPTTISGIKAVAHTIQTRSDDGTPTGTARSKLKSNATTSNGTTVTLTGSYQSQTDIYHTDPDTAAAWTASGINAAEAGYEKVS